MTVSAAKVRSLCTTSETALVRASRKPELEQLSPAVLRRNAQLARKLFDKWQDLGRSQSRATGRKTGAGAVDPNTAVKAEIFRDALNSFETRLAKADESASPAAKKPKSKTKRMRSAEHRSTRAAVRKGLTAVEDSLALEQRKKKKKKSK